LDTTPGATIYYTTNGTTPTTSSTKYTTAIAVSSTTTIQAIAVASGYNNSAVATGSYVISSSSPSINFSNGFTATGMAFNSVAKLNGTRLRLTDGGTYEATSAYYNTPVNVQSFTTNFSFQLTNPNADGFAFVIQNTGTTAVGPLGGGLGYGAGAPGGTPGIGKSVAVKFDLYNNSGEGTNSTGLYVNGASPTVPATTLGGGVNLHSGDIFNVQLTYDGTTLTMTITDASVPSDTFTTSWPVNIAGTVGSNTAYVGFSGGTGGLTATQEITSWTYTSGTSSPPPPPPPPPSTPIVYQAESVPATGSPNARVFTWTGFTNGVGITVDGTQVGNYITLTLNVAQAGTYDVKFGTKLYPTRGIGQLSISGTNVGPAANQYSSNYNGVFQEFDLGNVTLNAAGNYQFTFTVTGKSAASTGYTLAFDYIKLTPQ
jgi:Legume lectin domain/Chitobiase/beta-hexosaminidase C-terminal domain